MHKDAPATSESQSGVSFFGQIVHSESWKRALMWGTVVGLAVGVLDLAAFANEWRLGNWFDALDTPVDWVLEFAMNRFDSLEDSSAEALVHYSLIGCTGYWTIISLFVAMIYCFARAGGIRRMLRDRICRRALILGTGAGIFLGGANFLAMLNEVDVLQRCFDFLDRPGIALAEAVLERSGLMPLFPQSAAEESVFFFVATMAYWVIIGLMPAMLFCVVRVLRMRNGATEIAMSAG